FSTMRLICLPLYLERAEKSTRKIRRTESDSVFSGSAVGSSPYSRRIIGSHPAGDSGSGQRAGQFVPEFTADLGSRFGDRRGPAQRRATRAGCLAERKDPR